MRKALLWPQLLTMHDYMHLVINTKDIKNSKRPYLIKMILISCGFCDNTFLLCFLKMLNMFLLRLV